MTVATAKAASAAQPARPAPEERPPPAPSVTSPPPVLGAEEGDGGGLTAASRSERAAISMVDGDAAAARHAPGRPWGEAGRDMTMPAYAKDAAVSMETGPPARDGVALGGSRYAVHSVTLPSAGDDAHESMNALLENKRPRFCASA